MIYAASSLVESFGSRTRGIRPVNGVATIPGRIAGMFLDGARKEEGVWSVGFEAA